MLIFFMRIIYNSVYTDYPELLYETYKYCYGLSYLINMRILLLSAMLDLLGLIFLIIPSTRTIAIYFILSALIFLIYAKYEIKKANQYNTIGLRTPFQIRSLNIEEFIRKHFVSKNGKALTRKDWRKIKQADIGLYNDLLSDECNSFCYFYSLEIAKIFIDATLIWGAVKDPLEETQNYFAHAIIIRNNEVYDSNLRQSFNIDNYMKLFNFKIYKTWNYDKYSIKGFKESERVEFKNWCMQNDVVCNL